MLSLVIDIRSDIIEGTLVEFPDKEARKQSLPPKVIYSTFAILAYHVPFTTEYIVSSMVKGVEDLCAHMLLEKNNYTKDAIGEIHYVLSSPWIMSLSETVHKDFEKDTEITEGMIKAIMKESHDKLEKKYDKDMIFVEQKLFAIELNGYPVSEYIGKKAKKLQISFAFTLSSDTVIKQIKAAAEKSFHVRTFYLHSAILLQYLSYRVKIVDDREYILMHIHGEFTDIIILKKGICAYLGSFPFGSSTLIRESYHILESDFETTDSTLSLYLEGKLEDEQHSKIEKVILPVLTEWKDQCDAAFHAQGKDFIVPRETLLCAASHHLAFFKTELEKLGQKVVLDETPHRQIYVTALGTMLSM